jgi:hypothetical protein
LFLSLVAFLFVATTIVSIIVSLHSNSNFPNSSNASGDRMAYLSVLYEAHWEGLMTMREVICIDISEPEDNISDEGRNDSSKQCRSEDRDAAGATKFRYQRGSTLSKRQQCHISRTNLEGKILNGSFHIKVL